MPATPLFLHRLPNRHNFAGLAVILSEVACEEILVAGGDLLIDPDDERLALAVDADRLHRLRVAGCLTLHHQPSEAAAEDVD